MTAVGRWKRGALAALLVAGVSTIWLTSISAGSSTLSITVDQGLSPNFSLAVHDYVVRCNGTPLSVSVDAPAGYGVSVDGGALKPGAFNATVAVTTGQEFTMTVRHSDTNSSYYVRCLPPDFTHYTFTAQRPAPFGMFALDTALGKYTAVFDTDGVPVWWMRTQSGAGDSEVLRDGTYGFYDKASGLDQIYSLAAQPIRSLTAINGSTDQHELLLLDNGDYMIDSYVPRSGVDLSQFGGPSNTTVLDGEAEELTPSGQLVWSWNSGNHIPLSDTPQSWYNRQSSFGAPYDLFHLNAIQPHGPEVLLSARHTDAVWGIDHTTGNILWKLGGSARPESLTVVGDPQGSYPFGGMHDIRVLANGTITVHDNNYGLSNTPPRAVNYSINEQARTATYLSEVTDPTVTSALCCGSARLMSTGVWLICWGYNPLIAEYDTSGNQLWALKFIPGLFSYRAIPVPPKVPIANLRAGMDAQYPRVPGGAPSARFSASAARTEVDTRVSFDASASAASAGRTATTRWDFGDGRSGSGRRVTHAYARPGVYLVRLTVRDSAGAATTVSRPVTVLEGAALRPRPSFEVSGPARAGHPVAFDGTTSFVERATIVSYRWRFGDGGSAAEAMVAHAYKRAGRYRLTLTVTSSAGRSGSVTRTVTVR